MSDLANTAKTILVFDWGNTVMKIFPQYSGPMAAWPEVAEVEGIVEALEGLQRRFGMVIATNAADSTTEQVWKALERVGLSQYFKAVFTTHELGGALKPEIRYFRQLESVLSCPPYQLVMVGDSYPVDVLGAKAAGWRVIWYNPEHQTAPGLIPLQDAEISHLRDLPQMVDQTSLPDYPICLGWLVERAAPYNILDHIQLVAAVAYQLAVWLGSSGVVIDPVLTHRGAMLHDLAKIDTIRSRRGDHAEIARDLILERGQPLLAEIAYRHMPYSDPESPRRPLTWEQRIVHYADKLAEGARLVPIEERLVALKGRYPKYAEEMEKGWPLLSQFQQEICDRLKITPLQLIDRLRQSLGER